MSKYKGETFNIGGDNEINNITLVKKICKIFNKINKNEKFNYLDLISFVKDRPAHDLKYSVDSKKFSKTFNWKPKKKNFERNLKQTIIYYTK